MGAIAAGIAARWHWVPVLNGLLLATRSMGWLVNQKCLGTAWYDVHWCWFDRSHAYPGHRYWLPL